MTDIAPAVQDFSLDLYREATRNPGNAVVAPYSVAVVLAMAMVGARGETRAELQQLLRTDDPGGYGRELLRLTGGAGDAEFGEDTELEIANSLWMQEGTNWHDSFLATLTEAFGAEPGAADFGGDPGAAAKLINSWVADHTKDKIRKLVDPAMFDRMTRLVLANAAYFKAPWQDRFDDARPADFTTADGSVVSVPMMSKKLKKVTFRRAEEWQAVAVPFRGGRLAMGLVLPNPGVGLNAVVDAIGTSGLSAVTAMRRTPEIRLEVPRWKFSLHSQLNDALTALGVQSAFGAGSDFSGMTDAEPLQVSSVVHEAFVAVDEEGAEAAAATGMVIMARSAPARPLELIFDRPFLFLIFDQQTQLPLFIGRVENPLQD